MPITMYGPLLYVDIVNHVFPYHVFLPVLMGASLTCMWHTCIRSEELGLASYRNEDRTYVL